MSDLAEVKNYDVKIRIKNHDLPKARSSDKTINFDFSKVNSASSSLDFQNFRKREAERIDSLQGKLIIPNFSYLNCCTVE